MQEASILTFQAFFRSPCGCMVYTWAHASSHIGALVHNDTLDGEMEPLSFYVTAHLVPGSKPLSGAARATAEAEARSWFRA